MRKVIFSSLISLLLLLPSLVRADEGMWFLMFLKRLNERDMQKQGLQLTAEEIYSINNNSLKNAIVQFNGSCTASIISPEGLVITTVAMGQLQIFLLLSTTTFAMAIGQKPKLMSCLLSDFLCVSLCVWTMLPIVCSRW